MMITLLSKFSKDSIYQKKNLWSIICNKPYIVKYILYINFKRLCKRVNNTVVAGHTSGVSFFKFCFTLTNISCGIAAVLSQIQFFI